ncbi:hypothetical protein E4U43_000328 [Claviceps pusilla]|uniref:Uncharacterized protein n=1 Tax=Claviceps pusilla TaxID=123648 RepID=A0A9P7NC40_9HYPO|nr:hypothetical protein E4U43_000328 [Claviceps pusilla]
MTNAHGSVIDKDEITDKGVSCHPSLGAASQGIRPLPAVCPPSPVHTTGKEQAKTADKPVDKPMDETPSSLDAKGANGTVGGNVGHKLGAPKPVEVTSVPQTPLNGCSTPAGGTPRPELKITEEPAPSAAEPDIDPIIEPIVKRDDEVPKASPAASAPQGNRGQSPPLTESHQESEAPQAVNESVLPKVSESCSQEESAAVKAPELGAKEPTVNGIAGTDEPPLKSQAPVTGRKRKLDEPSDSGTAKLAENPPATQNAASTGKKRKLDKASSIQPMADDPATAANDPARPSLKTVRRKREKKPWTVGRTDRKTRSQGPVDL